MINIILDDNIIRFLTIFGEFHVSLYYYENYTRIVLRVYCNYIIDRSKNARILGIYTHIVPVQYMPDTITIKWK